MVETRPVMFAGGRFIGLHEGRHPQLESIVTMRDLSLSPSGSTAPLVPPPVPIHATNSSMSLP
jgi:hypothetical protein